MASFQTSQYIDTLTVNTIFTKGDSNTNIPAYRVLTTDGVGGTMWMTLSSFQFGAGFHTLLTTTGRYDADSATNATFSILDGPNAGLINDPTASNTAYLYAKAFGKFDISGGNTLYCFDSNTNTVNSNVLFVGTGGINIKGDPQTNTMFIDGRELPFVSTLPYSFNQMVVYSNAPLNTIAGSTVNKSIILQAQGPSSILSFLGEDILVIDTNYAANQIKFKLSSLTLSVLSSLVGDIDFLNTYAVDSFQLSTLSTTYGQIISFQNLQLAICTMSTTLDKKISFNSTSVGNVKDFSKGISSVWFEFQRDRYLLGITTNSNLLSTSGSLQDDIETLNDRVFTRGQDIIGSTLRTPYFWTSTIVSQVYASPEPLPTPTPSIKPLNVSFYQTYSSFYNVFNDRQPFGKPVQPNIFATSVNVVSGNTTISTVSTTTGTLFSNLFALQGTFAFLPNEDVHPFSVSWSGNLSFNINGTEYASNPIPYPRMNAFASNTINGIIYSQPVCVVNFSYSKINPTDFLSFSNLTDYIAGCIEYYNVAPIYPAYGYNTNEAPIYTQSITSFPVGFSTMSNLGGSPFLQLSSYVIIASTFYTSGCNTTFPVATSGYTSLSFYESTTTTSKTAYNINLSNAPTNNFPLRPYSASNTFGYDFTTTIPNSPYTFEIVYARQRDPEIFFISSLYSQNFQYSYNPTFYMSSALFTQYTSSVNTDIKNLTVSTVNGVAFSNLNFTDISTMSTIYTNLLNLTCSISASINSYSASLIQYGISSESTISTVYIGLNDLSSTIDGSINNYSASLIQYGISTESTISTVYIGINDLSSTIDGSINNYSASLIQYGISTESTISTVYIGINELSSTIDGSINNYSSSLIQYGISTESTISTVYIGINELLSTLSSSINDFSSSLIQYGTSSDSTISTTYNSLDQITSTLVGDIDVFSTALVNIPNTSSTFREVYTSTIFTSSVKLAGLTQPFIQYGVSGSINTPVAGSPYAGLGAGYFYTRNTLSTSYTNTSYSIQLTYYGAGLQTLPLQAVIVSSNSFDIVGPNATSAYWTTFGQLF
jgi:hypothetical protein